MKDRILKLDELINVRDLGGIRVPRGTTRFGKFLRSAIPYRLSRQDLDFLRDYGLTEDIDLRGGFDPRVEDVLGKEVWISYKKIPLEDDTSIRYVAAVRNNRAFSFSDHYIHMAENGKDWVYEVLSALEEAKGCVLFHCTTGKDRSGLIAALLLGICGVSQNDIVEDYRMSEDFLADFQSRTGIVPTGYNGLEIDKGFYQTHADNMEQLLQYFNDKYGGITGYLASCGVTEKTKDVLRERLCGCT